MRIKAIPGYEDYRISSCGVVFGKCVDKLKPKIRRDGYYNVCLSKGGEIKWKFVHRLVIEAFLGPIPRGEEVNHKNGIKGDNRLENLEIVTPKENMKHAREVLGWSQKGEKHPSSKLLDSERITIQDLYHKNNWTQQEIADHFGVTQSTISDVVNKWTRDL